MPTPENPAAAAPPRRRARAKSAQGKERAITMYGRFPRSIIPLRNTSMALVTAFGSLDDDREVMVPLVDLQLFGSPTPPDTTEVSLDDLKDEAVFSGIVSFENLAFIIQDMAGDFMDVTRLLAAQRGGGCQPDPVRMRFSANALRRAVARLERTADALEELATEEA